MAVITMKLALIGIVVLVILFFLFGEWVVAGVVLPVLFGYILAILGERISIHFKFDKAFGILLIPLVAIFIFGVSWWAVVGALLYLVGTEKIEKAASKIMKVIPFG